MPSQLARTVPPYTRSPPGRKRIRVHHVFLGSRFRLRLPSHPPHGVAVAIGLWLVPSTSTGDFHPRVVGHVGRTRVAGTVARPGSHRTVRTLFVYGSSGQRVIDLAAGRFATSKSSPLRQLWRVGDGDVLVCPVRQVDHEDQPALG